MLFLACRSDVLMLPVAAYTVLYRAPGAPRAVALSAAGFRLEAPPTVRLPSAPASVTRPTPKLPRAALSASTQWS